jgi:hypothetical protein
LPTSDWGFTSNIANGGSDLMLQLVRKRFTFGMDQLEIATPTEEEEPDQANMVTLIDEHDSSEEDYTDW